MKSNIYDESPVFSQSPQHNQFQYQLETQSSGRKRAIPVRRRPTALIRDIGFAASNCWYPLATFYKFPDKKQAICWDSIRCKQEPDPRVNFANIYKSEPLSQDSNPVKILAKTVVLIHPLLVLNSVTPHHIYLPIPSGNQVKFTLVIVKRKPTDVANLEVQVSPDAANPCFSTTALFQELAKHPRFKSSLSQLRRREAAAKASAQRQLSNTVAANNHVKYPNASQLLPQQQPLPYRVQDPRDTERIQYPELPNLAISSPPPRFPVIYQPTASRPPPAQYPGKVVYQKGKVALCHNCGIYSDNLEICSRCKKPNMGPISEDMTKQVPQSRKKIGKENETKREVVDLSSDENEDSQEAIIPGSGVMDSRLRSSLLCLTAEQNGKEFALDRAATPEDVIGILSEVTGKAEGCSMFALVTCSFIRIGTYKVSPGPVFSLLTTIGEVGLYFELPAHKTGITTKIGVPKHQILNLYGYSDPNTIYVKIQTGPKFAKWIRKALNMDEDSANGSCYFCPMHGDKSRHEFIIMFAEVDETKLAVLKRLYKDVYHPKSDEGPPDIPLASPESCSEGVIVHVEWKGHNCTSTQILDTKGGTEIPKLPPARVKSEHSLLVESRKLFHYPFVPVDADSSFYTDNSITVNTTDIACLGDLQYLNDQIIDFWMRQIVDRLSPEQKEKAYVFNTFFYKRLTAKPNCKRKSVNVFEYDSNLSQSEKRHCRVRNWTKKVDIFEKDFLFIPINENAHWFLVVVCYPGMVPLVTDLATNNNQPIPTTEKNMNSTTINTVNQSENGEPRHDDLPSDDSTEQKHGGDNMDTTTSDALTTDGGENPITHAPEAQDVKPIIRSNLPQAHIKRPCILLFDSLGPENRSRLFTTLREYLQIEHNIRKGQTRMFDRTSVVGIMPTVPSQPNGWDCGPYVLSYTEAFFRNPITNFTSGRTMRIHNWFTESEAASKRQEIYDFIVQYVKTNFPENSQYITERVIHEEEPDAMGDAPIS